MQVSHVNESGNVSAQGPYKITEDFESQLCDYTGAPYCVVLDNCSNALFLSLTYEDIRGCEVGIPCRTYPSVPCEVIHAGGIVKFYDGVAQGSYALSGTRTVDSALRFTSDMYVSGMFMCLSFTGPYKHLKLGKGGAILTDDLEAYQWFKRARFSGRNECSYLDDKFDMLGWNFYMLPELAARGLQLMSQFYNTDGSKVVNNDLQLSFPDLSQFPIYDQVPH